MKKRIKKVLSRKIKASLTVEASFIVPMILLTIAGGVNIGFDMFQQAKNITEIHEELKKLDPVKIVRSNTLIQDIKNQ